MPPVSFDIPLENVLWSGWLSKAGVKNKRWRKRFFCLTPRGLIYFESESCKVRKGTIPIFLCYGICSLSQKKFCLLTLKRIWLLQEDDKEPSSKTKTSDNVPLLACLEALLPQCTIMAQSWFKAPRPRYFGVLLSAGVFLRFTDQTLDTLYGWYEIHRVEYKSAQQIILIQRGNGSVHRLTLEDPTGSEAWTMLFQSTVDSALATWNRSKGGNVSGNTVDSTSTDYDFNLDDVDDRIATDEASSPTAVAAAAAAAAAVAMGTSEEEARTLSFGDSNGGGGSGSSPTQTGNHRVSLTPENITTMDAPERDRATATRTEGGNHNDDSSSSSNNGVDHDSSSSSSSSSNAPEVLLQELKEALSGKYFRITPRICTAIRCGVPSELRCSLWNGLSNAVNGGRRRTTITDGSGSGGSTQGWRRGSTLRTTKSSITNQYIIRNILKNVNGNALRAYMHVNDRITRHSLFHTGNETEQTQHVFSLHMICQRLLMPWLKRKEIGKDDENATEKEEDRAASDDTNEYTKEEDVFWLLTSIVEHLVPNLHDSAMQVQVESVVFCRLLQQREQARKWKTNTDEHVSDSSSSSLREHLKTISVDLRRVVMIWFSTLFLVTANDASKDRTNNSANSAINNTELMYRVMDEFLLDGWSVLYRFGLAYLAVHEQQLRRCTTSKEALRLLLPNLMPLTTAPIDDEQNVEQSQGTNNSTTVPPQPNMLLEKLSVGDPYISAKVGQENPSLLNTAAPSDQWLRDARRPKWAEAHITVAGWRRRMEHRNAAVNGVMAICSNFIEAMTAMWSTIGGIRPPQRRPNSNGDQYDPNTSNDHNDDHNDQHEFAGKEDSKTSSSSSSLLLFGYNADTSDMHQTLVKHELHDMVVKHMTLCHASARRAVCTSVKTCEMIDAAWEELCHHEEEARRRSEGYEGFVGDKEEESQSYRSGPNNTEEKKEWNAYDPVLDHLRYGRFIQESTLNQKKSNVEKDTLHLFTNAETTTTTATATEDTAGTTAVEEEETSPLQSQLTLMVDSAMAVAWSCAAACWACKHWLGRDAWWSSTWTGHGTSISPSEVLMPRHLYGASITSMKTIPSLAQSASSTTAKGAESSASSASSASSSSSTSSSSVPLPGKSSSSSGNALSAALNATTTNNNNNTTSLLMSSILNVNGGTTSVTKHRQVCSDVLEKFHSTATQIAKATERLLRCDIAGQRSRGGGSNDGVTLRSELIGGASHDKLTVLVKKLGELRKSLELCKESL